MNKSMNKSLNKFFKSDAGNFAITLGLTLTPIMMSVGAAADYSGFKRLENRMIISAETAMLAASKHVVRLREQDFAANNQYDLTNEEIVEELDSVFKPFFEANFAAGGYDLQEDQYFLEYIEADNNTKVRITVNYDTAVMRAFGISTLQATKDMIINLKVQPRNYVIDIVMCIDATGSMQNTLTAVQNNAMTFNADLREELGVGAASEKVKIRVRPIFYRDWEEGRDYQNAMVTYNAQLQVYNDALDAYESGTPTAGLPTHVRNQLTNEWNRSSWYYWDGNRYQRSRYWWQPRTHKRVRYEGTWYYFQNASELNAWILSFGGAPSHPGEPPVKPVNHGLNMYDDFIDLDPHSSETEDRDDRNQELTAFLSSTHAFGGHDWPEAAGACLNEAIRSDWYDTQSAESRLYFKVPPADVIISENDPVPVQSYTKITTIPVVVFWSDATINSYQLSRDWLSSTTPTSNTTFESLWNGNKPSADPWPPHMPPSTSVGTKLIDSRYRMMIRFGPSSASGFNTWATWNKVYYGGSLSTGNNEAVKVIAKKILEAIPDLLRVGS